MPAVFLGVAERLDINGAIEIIRLHRCPSFRHDCYRSAEKPASLKLGSDPIRQFSELEFAAMLKTAQIIHLSDPF